MIFFYRNKLKTLFSKMSFYKYFIMINAVQVTKLFDYFDCTKKGHRTKKTPLQTW